MNIHEYQAKAVLQEFEGPCPRGIAVLRAADAVAAANELGGPVWVVKSQIHAGGRGKGKFKEKEAGGQGGVRLAKAVAEVETFAGHMVRADPRDGTDRPLRQTSQPDLSRGRRQRRQGVLSFRPCRSISEPRRFRCF